MPSTSNNSFQSGIPEQAKLDVCSDVTRGDWIRDSLVPWIPFSNDSMTIGSIIPTGFESYVLIRHFGEGDYQGALGPTTLGTLLRVLSSFTNTPDHCIYAMWEGFGWGIPGVPFTPLSRSRFKRFIREFRLRYGSYPRRAEPIQSSPDPELHTLPSGLFNTELFTLPFRNYLLAEGPLMEALRVGHVRMGSFRAQSPNIMWPHDRNWILATEIDFDVTLVGGTEELIESILTTDSLTTERFLITDSVESLRVVN
jgi:hypothetical protein